MYIFQLYTIVTLGNGSSVTFNKYTSSQKKRKTINDEDDQECNIISLDSEYSEFFHLY